MSDRDTEQENGTESGRAPGDTPPARRRGPRRAVRRGTERESGFGVTNDERGGHGSNDERLHRDVPPHW
ncbi:hypothetical protein [Isoptericola hypogeus]|uniref:hypothetical protein n=1 Tax=Isoptericola hypogeus TaxID=300179 RepID=UPI0031CE6FD6